MKKLAFFVIAIVLFCAVAVYAYTSNSRVISKTAAGVKAAPVAQDASQCPYLAGQTKDGAAGAGSGTCPMTGGDCSQGSCPMGAKEATTHGKCHGDKGGATAAGDSGTCPAHHAKSKGEKSA